MFERFFGRKPNKVEVIIIAHLNARLDPTERYEIFEKPLEEFLNAEALGTVVGGGTELGIDNGESLSCDLEILVVDASEATIDKIISVLNGLGAPKGSEIVVDNNRRIKFGKLEGLALYLNGVDLSPDVYEKSDVDLTIDNIINAIDGVGFFRGYYRGSRETALYFYGWDFDQLKEAILRYASSDPLCNLCRIERFA